jgi:hypothetical protein
MPLRILTSCGAQRVHKAGPTGQGGRAGGHQMPEFGMKPSILPTVSSAGCEASGASSRERILMRDMTFRLSRVVRPRNNLRSLELILSQGKR